MNKKLFNSLKQGLKEAIAWKKGQKTKARVHVYMVRIKKKKSKS